MSNYNLYFKKKRGTIENQQDIDGVMFLLLQSMIGQMFKYKNLPEEIEGHVIEELLFSNGSLVFFELGGHKVVLPASNAYDLNIYGEAIKVRPIALNGQQFPERFIRDEYKFVGENVELANPKNAVLIKNNLQSISTWAFIEPFMDRLIYTWQSMTINQALSMRLRAFIHANKENSGALFGALNHVLGSKSPIKVISDKDNTLMNIEAVDMPTEYVPDKLWLDFTNTWDLILTFLGIDNKMATSKKERLITGEIEANNASISLFRDSMYEFRRDAVEQINKLFNLNIEVISAYDELESEQEELDAEEAPFEDSITETEAE